MWYNVEKKEKFTIGKPRVKLDLSGLEKIKKKSKKYEKTASVSLPYTEEQ